ncbi:tumor necrosis factor ligand superfamily member 10-like [Scyliorhinus torazame]
MPDTEPELAARGSPAPRCALLAPVLCISVLQLAVTIGFICYTQNQSLQKNVSGISEEVLLQLLSCNGNSSNPEWSELEIQKVSKSCLQSLKGLKQPLNQVLHGAAGKQRHKDLLKGSIRTRKNSWLTPYAHLTIKKTTRNSSDLETSFPGLKGKPIMSWEEKVGLAHLREMRYSQGSLRIKHRGLYYIYAQILFRYHADHPMVTREYQLIQYVYRKMAKYPKPTLILRGASTWCSGNHNLYSVYQGGVFSLLNGDKIFVTVSNVSLVDVDEASSYLGAFKMD